VFDPAVMWRYQYRSGVPSGSHDIDINVGLA
jgi:hypothetical protein